MENKRWNNMIRGNLEVEQHDKGKLRGGTT